MSGVVRLLFAFVTSAALSTTPQLHGGMTFVCMIPSTLHPAQLQLPLYGTGRRARSAQTAQKKRCEHAYSYILVLCGLLSAVCCLLCVWSFLSSRGAVGGDTKAIRGHREKPRNIIQENPCYLPANHVTGNYRYQVSHIPDIL